MTTQLKRALTLPLVTFYGIGTILGAGIYVLVGSVAGRAAYALPFAFAVAAVIAGVTAFSYAELVARLPRSGGEAVYVSAAFGRPWLTRAVGYGGVGVGVISAATIASGFAGYFGLFVTLDAWIVESVVVIVLAAVAAKGIAASAWAATLMTLVEIGGLVLVIAYGLPSVLDGALDGVSLVPADLDGWRGVAGGAFLAFYAFLGFEDIVNVAEEVRDAPRNLPRAIVLALVVSTVLYLGIGIVAIASIEPFALAASESPLATVASVYGIPAYFMSVVALVAITNGALIQMIKSSRILYGMAHLGDAPTVFGTVGARTRTPLVATAVVAIAVLAFALALSTVDLASLTSLVTLVIFATVNAALLALKRRVPAPGDIVTVPSWVPAVGLGLCAALIAVQLV